MQSSDRIRNVKVVLTLAAVVIAAASLVVSHFLIRDLQRQERNNMEVWAEAMRSLSHADETTDLNLVLKVINGNNFIPVVVLDERGAITTYRNLQIDEETAADSLQTLQRIVQTMKAAGRVITMELSTDLAQAPNKQEHIYIYYDESAILKRLASYPYVQLGVVGLFVLMAGYALLSSKRAEQNKVWVGLSRETAHQLGTPISSLMAWTEMLRETYPDDELLPEMSNDVKRLELIAERFSKIGSQPELREVNLQEVIRNVADYISRRASDKVNLTCSFPDDCTKVRICPPLFEWVIENLCKNAIDAMAGEGSITIYVYHHGPHIAIDVADTGKGISKKHFRTVFRPGFTTKKRGWGLGLSLAKRIIEEYHGGRIFVKESDPGRGTTFCILL
ncbi:MAG: HAMP domain-containing histidine kinase [Bacteroidaceae bacterium]|nr:HAMP domain-containing histidine kinase [Bacteroidaceae bacterium]MBR4966626.1 HAMP domain-containing histidine kinase [Bacteroidaceae bacterium]MBR5530948.1 HAMP domain-containing histidine kinase [Bacteroidaceae bacterium]MBR6481605.1 HAMP domain-containing histidine kinase [Bacteroidaceae bacterium]